MPQATTRKAMEEWFFLCAKQRRVKDVAGARAQVAEWRWFKGLVSPLHPEPLHWQRRRIPIGKPVARPRSPKGHQEIGLDAQGRVVVAISHQDRRPAVTIWQYLPGQILEISFPAFIDDDWVAPSWVSVLKVDRGGRVIETFRYGNRDWPEDGQPTRARLKAWSASGDFTRERLRYEGAALMAPISGQAGVGSKNSASPRGRRAG